jgi:hypothetical protein
MAKARPAIPTRRSDTATLAGLDGQTRDGGYQVDMSEKALSVSDNDININM